MRKKRISLVLALVLSVCLAIPAMARNISEFPPQNRDFFYPNYTGCLQSLLYYYHSTTRKKIVDSGNHFLIWEQSFLNFFRLSGVLSSKQRTLEAEKLSLYNTPFKKEVAIWGITLDILVFIKISPLV